MQPPANFQSLARRFAPRVPRSCPHNIRPLRGRHAFVLRDNGLAPGPNMRDIFLKPGPSSLAGVSESCVTISLARNQYWALNRPGGGVLEVIEDGAQLRHLFEASFD